MLKSITSSLVLLQVLYVYFRFKNPAKINHFPNQQKIRVSSGWYLTKGKMLNMPSGAFNSSNRAIFSDSLTAESELWSNVLLALVEILARTAGTTCTGCNMHYKHYFPSLHCISRPGRCLRREIAVWWPNFSHSLLLIPPPDYTPHTTHHHIAPHCSAPHQNTLHHTRLHHTAQHHTKPHCTTL